MTTPLAATPTRITLTDEEALAIAARSGKPWRAPLPTAGDELTELERSVARGRRSLLVRGAGDDHPVVMAALDAPVVARTFVADVAGAPSPHGTWSTFYEPEADTWVVELITPEGIHVLDRMPAAACIQLLVDTVRQVYAEGLRSASGEPSTLCVVGRPGERARVLEVGAGAMRLSDQYPDGRRSDLAMEGDADCAVAAVLKAHEHA